ncbi:ankyrin repeat domain-containing protein, partial [bacterium]|nr:ankyrin repeat domain-containing protein [bacterium]
MQGKDSSRRFPIQQELPIIAQQLPTQRQQRPRNAQQKQRIQRTAEQQKWKSYFKEIPRADLIRHRETEYTGVVIVYFSNAELLSWVNKIKKQQGIVQVFPKFNSSFDYLYYLLRDDMKFYLLLSKFVDAKNVLELTEEKLGSINEFIIIPMDIHEDYPILKSHHCLVSPPLHYAIQFKNIDVMIKLINAGAMINVPSFDWKRPTILTATQQIPVIDAVQYISTFEMLLRSCVTKDHDKMIADTNFFEQAFTLLMKHGMDVDTFSTRGHNTQTMSVFLTLREILDIKDQSGYSVFIPILFLNDLFLEEIFKSEDLVEPTSQMFTYLFQYFTITYLQQLSFRTMTIERLRDFWFPLSSFLHYRLRCQLKKDDTLVHRSGAWNRAIETVIEIFLDFRNLEEVRDNLLL